MFEDTLPPSPRPPRMEELGLEKLAEFVDVYLCAVCRRIVYVNPIATHSDVHMCPVNPDQRYDQGYVTKGSY